MSLEAALYAHLTADPTLTGYVPAARIYPGEPTVDAPSLPMITYAVSSSELLAPGLTRFQVDVRITCENSSTLSSIGDAVRALLDQTSFGFVQGSFFADSNTEADPDYVFFTLTQSYSVVWGGDDLPVPSTGATGSINYGPNGTIVVCGTLVDCQGNPLSLGGGGGRANVVRAGSSYAIQSSDDVILADAGSGSVTLTLPGAGASAGKTCVVKRVDGSAYGVVVDARSGDTIDGAAVYVLGGQYDGITVISDGTNWYVLSQIYYAAFA